jgi:hypothetical protein
MSYVPIIAGSTVATTAAAAARIRKMREEEEKMTQYKGDELNGWEFKIMRSASGKFKDYQTVKEVCDQEAQNGWEMVEKFDNNRIRFKRRVEKRGNDQFAKTDPYRTTYGAGEGTMVLIILSVVFGLIGAILLAVYLIKGGL